MEEVHQNPFLTVNEAGAFPRLKKRTLDNMRWVGTGPNFHKHGGSVYHHIAVRRALLKGVTPLRLKHTIATWLMQSGKDPSGFQTSLRQVFRYS